MPNGHYFVSAVPDTVLELNGLGQRVGQHRFPSLTRVLGLRNGNLLGQRGVCLVEITRQGQVVWEAVYGQPVDWACVCLGLVRLGFPALQEDVGNSFSYYLGRLRHRDALVRREAAWKLAQRRSWAANALPALITALRDPDHFVPIAAAQALENVGPRAVSAVPALIDALEKEGDLFLAYQKALAGIGPAALPRLCRAVREDRRPLVRGRVAEALALLQEEVATPIPELLQACKDPDWRVRAVVLEALCPLALKYPPYCQALLDALSDPNPQVGLTASQALPWLGAAAAPALPVLRRLSQEAQGDRLEYVLTALGHIGRNDPTVLPLVLDHLKAQSPFPIRLAAAHAVSLMGPNGRRAVPVLAAWLQANRGKLDPKASLAEQALLEALGRLSPHDDRARRLLGHLLAHPKQCNDRTGCALALARHLSGPRSRQALSVLLHEDYSKAYSAVAPLLRAREEEAVPSLVQLIARGNPEERLKGLYYLSELGPAARPAVAVLTAFVGPEHPQWRRLAIRTLGNVGPDAGSAIPLLTPLVHDPEEGIARLAAVALGKIDSGDPTVVSILHALLSDRRKDLRLRCAAAWGLGLQGKQAHAAVPTLLAILQAPLDPDARTEEASRHFLFGMAAAPEMSRDQPALLERDLRVNALLALGRIGSDAAATVPVLRQWCVNANADPLDRWAAAVSLGRMGTAARIAVPDLIKLLKEDETPSAVQLAVLGALADIAGDKAVARAALDRARTEGPRPVRLAARRALDRGTGP